MNTHTMERESPAWPGEWLRGHKRTRNPVLDKNRNISRALDFSYQGASSKGKVGTELERLSGEII